MCEVCGCSEPVVELKRDPDELRREFEERRDAVERLVERRNEADRRLDEHELELETAEA